MRIFKDGEQYSYYNEGEIDLDHSLLVGNKNAGSGNTVVRKPLILPMECKRMEGFLTLFDDHELRSTPAIERGPKWQRHTDIGTSSNLGGTTLWRRLWFRVEIIDDPKYQETIKSDDKQKQENNVGLYKTILLRYWMYPENVEQQEVISPVHYKTISIFFYKLETLYNIFHMIRMFFSLLITRAWIYMF